MIRRGSFTGRLRLRAAAPFFLVLPPAALLVASCGGPAVTVTSTPDVQTVLRQRAGEVFASTPGPGDESPGNLISAAELDSRLKSPAWSSQTFLLDTRPENEWEQEGHIQGAVHIPLQQVAEPQYLDTLPRDRLIVCISSTGHTAAQLASVLRWLGYRAVLLDHGMAAWTKTADRQWMINDVRAGMAEDRALVHDGPPPPAAQAPPAPFTEPPAEDLETLTNAARALLREDVFEKQYPYNNAFAKDLYDLLQDPFYSQQTFLLDVRPEASWTDVGHIEGAVHIDWRSLGLPENLARLPQDKLIVVLGDTGQTAAQATAILRMLGYNAVTLRSGVTAWAATPDSPLSLAAFQGDYPVVK